MGFWPRSTTPSNDPFTKLDRRPEAGIIGHVFAWRAYKRLVEQGAEREERFLVVFDRLEATLERNNRVIDEVIDEMRAQRQAILHVLDRLDGGEQPA